MYKTSNVGKKNKIFCVLVVPPPVNGMTLANKKMLDVLENMGFQVEPYTISRVEKTSLFWKLNKNLKLFFCLVKVFIKKNKEDGIYFIPDAAVGLWLNLFLHLPIIIAMRGPVIMHHHTFQYCRKKSLPMSIMVHFLGSRLLNICLSSLMCNKFKAKYSKAECIPLGNYLLADITPKSGSDDDLKTRSDSIFNIGFLSNITEDKGILEFLEVVKRLNEGEEDIKFKGIIAGPMDKSVLKTVTENVSKFAEMFEIIGPVYNQRKNEFIAKTHILLFPSRYANEAYPLTILEFLISSTPVIATDIGCIPEILKSEENVFPKKTFIENAVQRTRQICSSATTYLSEAKKAKSHSVCLREESQFQIQKLTDKINNYYENVG